MHELSVPMDGKLMQMYAIFRPYGRKVSATLGYFPSTRTENSLQLHNFSSI